MTSDTHRERPLVLVAEDDHDIRRLLTLQMKLEGYEVVDVADGREALRLARERRPDVAVLDIVMPGMRGSDVAQEIRHDPNVSGMAIMLLTALGRESDVLLGFESGADDYVAKPFSPAEVRARVRALLQRR